MRTETLMPDTDTITATSRAVVEDYVAALSAADADAIRGAFAEDAEWCLTGELPLSGTWKGRDVIFDAFLTRAMESYEPGSVSFEVTHLLGDGDRVAMEWITRGRSRRGSPTRTTTSGSSPCATAGSRRSASTWRAPRPRTRCSARERRRFRRRSGPARRALERVEDVRDEIVVVLDAA